MIFVDELIGNSVFDELLSTPIAAVVVASFVNTKSSVENLRCADNEVRIL